MAWDLRYPSLGAEKDGQPDEETTGVLAMPGTYTVEMAKRVDGVVTPLAGPVEFEVVRLRERGMPGKPLPEALTAFLPGNRRDCNAWSNGTNAVSGRFAGRARGTPSGSRWYGPMAGQPLAVHRDSRHRKTGLAELNDDSGQPPPRHDEGSNGRCPSSARLGRGTGRHLPVDLWADGDASRSRWNLAKAQFGRRYGTALRATWDEELPQLERALEARPAFRGPRGGVCRDGKRLSAKGVAAGDRSQPRCSGKS